MYKYPTVRRKQRIIEIAIYKQDYNMESDAPSATNSSIAPKTMISVEFITSPQAADKLFQL